MSQTKTGLQLGQRVRVLRALKRRWVDESKESNRPYWARRGQDRWLTEELSVPIEGIVTGKRTRFDGYTEYDDDYGYQFHQTAAVPTVEITFSLHRKPLIARPEDVEVVD